ncbi:unnamed protein product [Thelazia callipaeda]|uniref:Small conductance calcium-activated potassium channel protein n=1 Tax=Thelazia callipaeda TaxID=103827 RepID=A0A0N5CSG9_THECL|nr:unnamed protein product [Thelazia callipaeda]
MATSWNLVSETLLSCRRQVENATHVRKDDQRGDDEAYKRIISNPASRHLSSRSEDYDDIRYQLLERRLSDIESHLEKMENKINNSLEQILRVLIPENAQSNSSPGRSSKDTSTRTIYSSRSASGTHLFRLGNRREELMPISRLQSSVTETDDIDSPFIGISYALPAPPPTSTLRSSQPRRSPRPSLILSTSSHSTPTKSDLSPDDTDTLL